MHFTVNEIHLIQEAIAEVTRFYFKKTTEDERRGSELYRHAVFLDQIAQKFGRAKLELVAAKD